MVALVGQTFTVPMQHALVQLQQELNNPMLTLDQILRTLDRGDKLKTFEKYLADFRAGGIDPYKVCRRRRIYRWDVLVLTIRPWRGYFVELGKPPELTGVFFWDGSISKGKGLKQLQLILQNLKP